MALKYGMNLEDFDDVGDDADGLMAMLGGGGEPTRSNTFRRQAEADALEDQALEEMEFEADPDPDYGKPAFEDRVFPDEPKTPAKRVTQAVRKDVKGKVAMLLMVAGSTWAGKDEACGTVFLESIPDQVDEDGDTAVGIAGALADIICDSPDMVKWFGGSGKYMKWLTLAMTLQPVLNTAFHHHITHQITSGEPQQQDWSAYTSG